MKHYKLKKQAKKTFYVLIVCVILIVCLAVYVKIVKDNTKILLSSTEYTIEVNEEYELPEVKATYHNQDITNKLTINNTIDNSKLGEYKVEYTYKVFGVFSVKRILKVYVVDTQAPNAKFDGGYIFFVPSEGSYELPKVIATDNYDDECFVEYDNKINQKQDGLQTVTYKICDKSNNCNYQFLNVYVSDELNNNTFDKEIYNTSNYFDTLKKHSDIGANQFEEYLLVGDSNIGMLQYNGLIPPEYVCSKMCMSPNNIKMNITYAGIERDYDIFVLINTLKSKNIVLSVGQCQIGFSTVDEFIEQYKEAIYVIKNNDNHPNVVVSEILPVISDDVKDKPTNKEINIFNYYLAKLCEEMNVPFITPSEVLKDENGNGIEEYYDPDGYHLNVRGEEIYLEYLRTHLPYVN